MSKTLLKRDLARSGLTLKDAQKLHLRLRNSDQNETDFGHAVGGVLLPYFGIDGREIDYGRVRLFHSAFNSEGGLQPKYLQPAGSQVHAYFPPYLDWAAVVSDPELPLVITEGEKKAAKGSKSGIPTLGLGGVWSFQQKLRKQILIPDLAQITWGGRKVFLCFDSDAEENAAVNAALTRLDETLVSMGAQIRRVILPTARGEIAGLDDVLVSAADASAAYKELLEEADANIDPVQEAIDDFGSGHVLVREAASAYDMKTGAIMGRKKFTDAYADHTIRVFGMNGQPKEKTLPDLWWSSPRKRSADRVDIFPDQPPGEVVQEPSGIRVLNVFRGMGVEPKKGSALLWTQFLKGLIANEDERNWFERWLAYPLQHPGEKLYTTPFLWGGQGLGKSFIGTFMSRIYGPSYRVLKTDMLFGSFNSWANGALFVMADDLSPDNRKQCASTLKLYVAGNRIPINAKYQPEYQLENRCQFYLNANAPQALPLEDGQSNRRYFVSQVGKSSRPVAWFTDELHPWCHNGGAEAVYYRLMHLDLKGFNPRAPAPDTRSRQEALGTTATTVEHWCASLGENFPGVEVLTFNELERAYRNQTGDRFTKPGVFRYTLARYTTSLGQFKVTGAFRSFIAIREGEKWQKKPREAADRWAEKNRLGI